MFKFHTKIMKKSYRMASNVRKFNWLTLNLHSLELREEDTVGRDALLTQTLASLCRNTTSYYCNNLPSRLEDDFQLKWPRYELFLPALPTGTMLRSESSDYVFALELLTACGTNSYILKKHAVRLMALLDPKQWHDGDDRDGSNPLFLKRFQKMTNTS